MTSDIVEEESVSIEEKPKNQPGGFSPGSIVLLGSIVVAAVIVGIALVRQNETQPLDGPAPAFDFTTFDGESYNLQDFRGKVVVLNFWASWCGPCAFESPELQAAWEDYRDKDVVFLGIAYADNGPNSLEFIERYQLDYYNAPDVGTVISELYHIMGVPETFIIDQHGDIVQFFIAPVTAFQISQVIDPLLQEDDS